MLWIHAERLHENNAFQYFIQKAATRGGTRAAVGNRHDRLRCDLDREPIAVEDAPRTTPKRGGYAIRGSRIRDMTRIVETDPMREERAFSPRRSRSPARRAP
jgi:hypothetical protein